MKTILATLSFAILLCGYLVLPCPAQQPAPAKLDPKIYDAYLGSYQLVSGELIVIGRSQYRLHYYEPQTRRFRALRPQSDSIFVAGTSLLIYSPVELEIDFLKNSKGEVLGLVIKEQGLPDRSADKISFYTEEHISFRNGEIDLSGTLLTPNTRGPHPAVIFIHGSGEQDRNGSLSLIRLAADHFARHGIAALIFDKRGVGASSGDWAKASFDDLAGDAVAGLKTLQRHGEINPKQIGFWGISQAAWVMAKATLLSKDIAFIIDVSGAGSGVTVAQQNNYSTATEMRIAGCSEEEIDQVITAYNLFFDVIRVGAGGDGTKLDAAVRRLQKNAKLKDRLPPLFSEIDWKNRNQWFLALDIDFNPIPLWEKYDGPVLGIFGEVDSSTPVREVVPIFEKALASRKHKETLIKLFPKAHHVMLEAETGSNEELARLKRFVPGYFETMIDWLRQRVDVPK